MLKQSVLFVNCSLILCLISLSATAGDFKIGPDVPLDSLAISSGNGIYLVVWRDLRNAASPQIRGVTVNTGGTISADFPISSASALPLPGPVQRNTVAYDGTRFLAIWADNQNGGAGIRGSFVTPDGLTTPDFLISRITRTDNLAPQVVFTGSDYIVAWQDNSLSSGGAGTQIFYTRVSLAGAVGSLSAVQKNSAAGTLQSLEFLVAGPNSETMLVFQDKSTLPNSTYSLQIESNGTLTGPASGTLLFRQDFSTQGFGAPIGATFDGIDYIILSSYNAQFDSTVFKTRLQVNSNVIRPSGSFAEVGQGATGLDEDQFPRASVNNGSEFLFLRNSKVSDTAYHILSKRVSTIGVDNDPNMPLLDTAPQGILNGACAASTGMQYLAVWMDGRRGGDQPNSQLNIYGTLIDDTLPGDPTHPRLLALARAIPQIGNSPLTVSFDDLGSSGMPDTLGWNFGDGTTSDKAVLTHKYTTSGIFLAIFTLTRAGFSYHDFVRIFVDENTLGGGGGPPQTIGGSLGPVSNNVDTDIYITQLIATLDFSKAKNDSVRFSGYMNPSSLPANFANTPGSFTIGNNSYSFMLGATGTTVTSNGNSFLPTVNFGLNPFSGGFDITTSIDELQSTFAQFGAVNQEVAKPGQKITVPFTFKFGNISLQSTVTAIYTAKAGKKGLVDYSFAISGDTNSGYLHIFGATAAQQGKTDFVHKFIIDGSIGIGNGLSLLKANSGYWRITFGNVVEDIPVSAIKLMNNNYSYHVTGKHTGLTDMFYNTKNGNFTVAYQLVPATGNNPSGMPLANTLTSRADMALSFDLDLASGAEFQASIYVRFTRKTFAATKWSLR